MKTYILVDSENTPLQDADFARDEQFELLIFIGKTQTKFPRELVLAVQAMGPRARYIEMSGSGKNALDFHLAYYLGVLSNQTPDARFFIVSKDTGFDPLVTHLAAKGTVVRRVSDTSTLRPTKPLPVSKTDTGSRADIVTKHLIATPKNRPARLKTLQSTIQSLLGVRDQPLSEDDIRGIVAALQTRGALSVNATKITYTLPA